MALSDLVLPLLVLSLPIFMVKRVVALRLECASWAASLPYIAWLAWISISAAMGADFHLGTVDPYVIKKLIGFGVLALYVAAGYFVAQTLGYDAMVRILLWVAAFSTIIGILRLFALPLDISYASLPYGYRLLGMTHNPNLFGLQQGAIVVFCLDWLRRTRGRTAWSDRPTGAEWLLATAMAGLWLSGSRTAIGAVCIVVLPLLLLQRLPFALLVRCVILSAIIASVGFGIFSGFRASIEVLSKSVPFLRSLGKPFEYSGIFLTGEAQGIDHRTYIHDRARALFAEHPWFGVGLGQFYLGFQQTGDSRAGEIHNSYLWIATELGLVGVFAALACFFQSAKKAIRLAIANNAITPACLLAFYAVAAVGAEISYQRPLYFLCGALLLGNTVGERPLQSPGRKEDTRLQ